MFVVSRFMLAPNTLNTHSFSLAPSLSFGSSLSSAHWIWCALAANPHTGDIGKKTHGCSEKLGTICMWRPMVGYIRRQRGRERRFMGRWVTICGCAASTATQVLHPSQQKYKLNVVTRLLYECCVQCPVAARWFSFIFCNRKFGSLCHGKGSSPSSSPICWSFMCVLAMAVYNIHTMRLLCGPLVALCPVSHSQFVYWRCSRYDRSKWENIYCGVFEVEANVSQPGTANLCLCCVHLSNIEKPYHNHVDAWTLITLLKQSTPHTQPFACQLSIELSQWQIENSFKRFTERIWLVRILTESCLELIFWRGFWWRIYARHSCCAGGECVWQGRRELGAEVNSSKWR